MIPATMVWEIRTTATANNVNGGGFNSARGGIDYSQQDAAQLSLTDITTSGATATTISSVTGGFTAAMVGNIIHITAGTNLTPGWYEIVTFTDANNVVLDRTPSPAGAGSAGVGNVGGAMSLNSTLDDDLFEAFVAGNTVWMKSGTYTLGESIATSVDGTGTLNIKWLGYATTRGDAPTGSTRPHINCGASTAITVGDFWTIKGIKVTGAANSVLVYGTDCRLENVFALNHSASAARVALNCGDRASLVACEAVSQNGSAVNAGAGVYLLGCYFHDSDVGLDQGTSTFNTVLFSVFENNATADWRITGTLGRSFAGNNTFYGGSSPRGIGVQTTGATCTGLRIYNNIFYGKATAIEIGTVEQDSVIEDYNTFFNNTTDRTNIATGSNSVAVDPAFSGAVQITGTTATTSGTTLTQSGGDFSTVEDGVDFLRVLSGTGVTVAVYLIESHTATTVTVNNTLGTSSGGDVAYVIGTGHDFSVTGDV